MSLSKSAINKNHTYLDTILRLDFIKRYFDHYRGVPLSGWKQIALSFIHDMASSVSFFLSLYLVNTLHLNIETAGLIISMYGIGKAVGGVLGGKLADKISCNKILITCLLVEVFLYLSLCYAYSVPFLGLLEFMLGASGYIFTTANKVGVLNSVKDKSNIQLKIISIFYAASNLAMALSAIMINSLSTLGYHYVFFTSSTLLLIGVFIAVNELFRNKDSNQLAICLPEQRSSSISKTENDHSIVAWMALCSLFCVGLIIAQLGTTYSVYLADNFPALGVKAVSIFFALNSFLIFFFQTPLTSYIGKYNKILTMGMGAFLMAISMGLLNVAFTFSIAIISAIIYTLGEMLFFSTAQFIVYRYNGEHRKGQSLGLFQTTFALSLITGPATGGYIYYHLGSHILWYSCSLIGIFCLTMAVYFKKYDVIE